jgi:hypothetical protein
MKRIIPIILCLCTFPAFAQKPEPKLTELQAAKIQLTMKDWQIIQLQQQQINAAAASAQKTVMEQVAAVKKELGLDDTWDFNYQTLAFFKKPVPAKTEAPAKK